jgi:hypothetical protein
MPRPNRSEPVSDLLDQLESAAAIIRRLEQTIRKIARERHEWDRDRYILEIDRDAWRESSEYYKALAEGRF